MDGILEIEIKIEGKREEEEGRKRHIVSVFHGVALPFVELQVEISNLDGEAGPRRSDLIPGTFGKATFNLVVI